MDATNAGDFEAGLSVFAPDATFDVSTAGLGVFRGVAAIRAYLEEWVGTYEEQRFSEWEGEELGGGVVLALATFESRLPGSTATVTERWAFVCRFREASIVAVTADGDVDRARALAAELAAETGVSADTDAARAPLSARRSPETSETHVRRLTSPR